METNKAYKPEYIENQVNNNCQQFFAPISGCVFAMPGSHVHMTPNSDAVPQGTPYEAEDELQTPEPTSRGPKKYSLFRDKYDERDEARTKTEVERLKSYISEHHLGNTKFDSSVRSKLNKVVATFWTWWKDKGWVREKFEGASFYRFITEDCGLECPVDEKTFPATIRKIIESGKRDPEIYSNVSSYFEKE